MLTVSQNMPPVYGDQRESYCGSFWANSEFKVLFADVAPKVHIPDKSSSKTPPYKVQRCAVNSGCTSMTNAKNNLRSTKQYAYPCKDVSAKKRILKRRQYPAHYHTVTGNTALPYSLNLNSKMLQDTQLHWSNWI